MADLKVETRPLDALIPYARNSRTHGEHQLVQLENSLVEFGWTMPVLLDEQGVMIAGHGRVMAAQRVYKRGKLIRWLTGKNLPKDHAPVLVAHGWTDDQKRAYVIADNRLAEGAGWDFQTLALELGSLDPALANLAGFADEELSALLNVDPPPSLEDLERRHGAGSDRDFWPTHKLSAPKETLDAFKALLAALDADEAAALARVTQLAQSALGQRQAKRKAAAA